MGKTKVNYKYYNLMSELQKYTVSYKTFDSLMAEIEDDLSSLSAEGYLFPDKYYKIVETCNSKLSVKINPIKEDVITVKNGKGKLPKDFKLLNSAYLCISYLDGSTTTDSYNREYIKPNKYSLKDISTSCNVLTTIEDSKGVMSFVVLKKSSQTWFRINQIVSLHVQNSDSYCASSCLRGFSNLRNIQIIKEDDDYYIISAIDGEVYISYTSQMTDDEGNLLILDHPLVQEYYEYAIKERIYEDLWLNGIEEYQNKLAYMSEKLRKAKIEALSFVRMFDFSELKQVYFDNRKLMKMKYDRIIQE